MGPTGRSDRCSDTEQQQPQEEGTREAAGVPRAQRRAAEDVQGEGDGGPSGALGAVTPKLRERLSRSREQRRTSL